MACTTFINLFYLFYASILMCVSPLSSFLSCPFCPFCPFCASCLAPCLLRRRARSTHLTMIDTMTARNSPRTRLRRRTRAACDPPCVLFPRVSAPRGLFRPQRTHPTAQTRLRLRTSRGRCAGTLPLGDQYTPMHTRDTGVQHQITPCCAPTLSSAGSPSATGLSRTGTPQHDSQAPK